MKRILFATSLLLLAVTCFSQEKFRSNTIAGIYAGGGAATSNNYNIAPSLGFVLIKGYGNRSFFGGTLFYQAFSLRYDNEQNSARNGTGNAGAILRNVSSYVFLAPQFEQSLGKHNNFHVYFNLGIGFKVSGFDSLRKWDHSYGNPGVYNFDSSLDLSKNLNSMVFRIGVGFNQLLGLGPHWRLIFYEDFGFLPGGITKTGDPYNSSRTQYTPHKLTPGYISVRIGISHTKYQYTR